MQNFYLKIWHVVNFLIENLTRRKKNISKSDAFFSHDKIWRVVFFSIQNLTRNENFNSKSCFLKKQEKWKICHSRGVKWTKTWFFESEKFFKNWHVEKFWIQNLTRCKYFKPKSDVFNFFYFKIWHVVRTFIQNLFFKSSFQFLAELLSKCY